MSKECKNFKVCGNETTIGGKWCQHCSWKWQFKQMGYEMTATLEDGKIHGIILTREDLIRK